MTLILRGVAIVNADLLLLVRVLPSAPLVVLVEIHHEERMFKVDEEVAHIRHFLWLLVVLDDVQGSVPVSVLLVNLVLELLLRVATGNVFDAEVGAEVFALLDALNVHWLAVVGAHRFRRGACVLRSRRTLRLVAAHLIRVRGLTPERHRELAVAIVVPAEKIETDLRARAVNVLRLGRLHVVADPEGACLDWVFQSSHHSWRLV